MDDSWQKLMGIDCGSDDGPSSPIFHKKKWVVLPTSLKRSGSGPLLTKCPEKKLKNKRRNDSKTSVQVLDQNSAMPPEDKSLENSTVEEEDPLVIYSTTPTKNCKHKRKTIDLLSCSFRSEVSFSKKSKLIDDNLFELSKDSSDIKLEKNGNELGEETDMPTSIEVSPLQSNKTNLSQKSSTSKPQRKLLYSFNEKSNSSLKTPTVTVNDIIKSVIMIDEADIHSSPKKNRQTSFEVQSNDFQSVTSLTNGNLKDCLKKGNDLASLPSKSALEKCNDSFGNCMFTEVENECLSTKNICLNSNYNKVPLTSDCLEIPDDRNPMDETFSNYRFTEIEEDYACLGRQGLKDSSPVTSSVKSVVRGPVSSYSSPQNNLGKNIWSKLENEDIVTNHLTCHKSTVLNNAKFCALDNEGDKTLFDGNGSEDSYIKSCGDDKDIFNSTISPLKSITKLEMVTDKEIFLSTSKECFNELDAISTEEFRNNQSANHHHELNKTLKEDFLNQSIENPEKDLLNKSVSKLDVTLTDIMQRLINKRINNDLKSNSKNQNLDKHIASNRNSSFNGLKQEIKYKEESKNNELCDQTLGNISSECIPEQSNLLGTNETVFLTQEYLENVKPEDSLDTSVVYYQQSFDYMISAEVKSRSSGNNFAVPPVEHEPSLLNRSLSSEICIRADDEDRSPNNSFVYNYKTTDLNESNASNLNKSIIENTIKSPICSDDLNNSYGTKLTQCEHFCDNPVANCSPDVTYGVEDPEKINDAKIHSDNIHNDINKFPNRTSFTSGVSALNSDLISQESLQQFNYSFRLERDDLDLQKEENNLDNQEIDDINVNNVYSNCSSSVMMTVQNIKNSEEYFRNRKSKCKDIEEEPILIKEEDNVVRDGICYEDRGVLVKNNNVDSVNLKNLSSDKSINEYNEHSTLCLSEINKLDLKQLQHCSKSGTETSTHGKINNDVEETAQLAHPILLQKPCYPLTHQKSDADHSCPSASGKHNNTSKESVLSHDLIVTNQDTFQQCVLDSHITSLNLQTEKNTSNKMDLTESSSSFNRISKSIDDSRSVLNDNEENEFKTDTDFTFKSPLPRPFKVNNFMFSSAGGKNIKVSKNALAKVKSLFNEILEIDPKENKDTEEKTVMNQVCKTSLPSSSKSSNFLFTSAGGRKIRGSENVLNKVKPNVSTIPESHPTGYENSVDKKDTNDALRSFIPCLSKDDNFMFSSASGKKITISEEALFKVKSKFNEIFESSSVEVDCADAKVDTDPAPNVFVSGPSANDNLLVSCSNDIKDSEDELAKDKSNFDEISKSYLAGDNKTDNESYMNQMPKTSIHNSSKIDNFMFSTAGGKNIKVSDVALAKIKSKFNDIMESHESEAIKDVAETDKHQETKKISPSLSNIDNFKFSSASAEKYSGEPSIEVESEPNRILGNNPEDIKTIDQESKRSLPISSKSDNFMFSSAGGKNIKVSECSLSKVKSKFSEVFEISLTDVDFSKAERGINQPPKMTLSNYGKASNSMFSSASGNNIKVSDGALARVKAKFNEIMDSHEADASVKDKTETNIDRTTPITFFPSSGTAGNFMFSSASGKNITVSDDALAKVKTKFHEIMESYQDVEIKEKAEKNIGQQSEKIVTSSGTSNFMFSSASGNYVKVSESALTKVKSKFNEVLGTFPTEVETDWKEVSKKCLPYSSITDDFMLSRTIRKNVEVSDDSASNVKAESMEMHEDKLIKGKAESNIDQTPKKSFSNSGIAGNFVFSSASGKNITVSDDALAKVRSKFNDILNSTWNEVKGTETEADVKAISESFLTGSEKADNLIFSSTTGNNIIASKVAESKPKLYQLSGNNLIEGENDNIEINNRQLFETSFSCFDKSDPFSSSTDETKTVEIPDVILDGKKSALNRLLKDNSPQIELNQSRNVLDELTKNPLSITNKNDNSTPFSPDFVDDKLPHRNLLESFISVPKNNEMECENIPYKFSEVKFSTARGKDISVSEDALLKVRSKFSEVMDNTSMHLSDAGKSDNFFQHANSPNKIFSDDVCVDPVLNEIEGCLALTPKNSHPFTKKYMNEKLSNSLNQNDKKSKSSHSGHSVSDQPLAKKVCFQPGIVNITQKPTTDISGHNVKELKMQGFPFTQSISQSVLDKEIDEIEKKKCTRELFNLNDNESNSKPDECFENKDLASSKCSSQSRSEEGDMTMIYEVSDSAAAFMADCTPDRSLLSSPSSFFNRKSMKPMKLLEMEFDDVDDEIMVEAELKIIPEQIIKNPVTKVSTNDSLDSISFRSCSIELLSIRNDQRKRIDEVINEKLKQRPLSSPGLYMTLRNGSSLYRISENLQPFLDQRQLYQLGLKEEILRINSTNAEAFEFCAESFFSYDECFSTKGIVDLGYGFSLILSDDNKVGLIELSRCFLSNPNVDPSLVSSAWIKNHFKWIVWKLACYERSFPKHLANRSLTPENILHQLKYRYDREVDLAQRPAIRKILECDEPSSRRLIACVADIRIVDSSDGESNHEIELTDGWYSVWACIDPAMKNLIDRKKVKIGTKLIFQAAELLNCTEGCDPLEIASSVRLKLHTNCARRVKWHTKMGFTRYPGPIRVPLNSILHNGGLVGLTSAIIARVYPLLYMSKDADGKIVLRNAHAEHHASSLKENDLTVKSEELFEKLFPEVESKYKSGIVKFDKNSITKIKDPALLWKIVSNESDPTEVQSFMTPDQLLEVRKYHELISSKIREEVQALVKKKLEELFPSQKAKCLLKLRLLDTTSGSNALLTVWNPSEDLLQILVEKKCFDFYALNASGTRDKVLQLSSTSRTIYKEKTVSKPITDFERKVTSIHDIVANSVSAKFGEMDIVGIVIFIKEPEKPWGVTNVYLSDSEESFLMITFWTSLKTFGCDDTLKPGSTVACINLQWRQGSGSYVIPSTYANEMTYFSTNPNQDYLIKVFQEIKSSISLKNLEDFIIERRRILFTILKEREYNSKTPISRVETPKVLKRLENLKKYGEASPLPKLSLLSSPDIHRKFRSPKSGGS